MSHIVIAVFLMVRSACAQTDHPAAAPKMACESFVADLTECPDHAGDIESVSGETAQQATGARRERSLPKR